MIPLYTIMSAPLLMLARVPIVLWYAHSHLSIKLKIAHWLSKRIVSINKSSYPYKHEKLESIGHGIATEHFLPVNIAGQSTYVISLIGRISPIKDLETFINSIEILSSRWICGERKYCPAQFLSGTKEYKKMLSMSLIDKGLEKTVSISPPIPNSEVAKIFRGSFAHVNCSVPNHSLDKTVLEAMASGIPEPYFNSGI